jgi:hypothetical protein
MYALFLYLGFGEDFYRRIANVKYPVFNILLISGLYACLTFAM